MSTVKAAKSDFSQIVGIEHPSVSSSDYISQISQRVDLEMQQCLATIKGHFKPNTIIILKDLSVEFIRTASIAVLAKYFIFQQSEKDSSKDNNQMMAIALMLGPLFSKIFSQSFSNIGRKVSLLFCPFLVSPGIKEAVNYRAKFEKIKHLLTPSMRELIERLIYRYTFVLEYHNFDLKEFAAAIEIALRLPIYPKPLEAINPKIKELLESYPDNIKTTMFQRVSEICRHSHLESPKRRVTPIMLVGPPGTGKTYLVRQIAEALALPLCEVKISEYQSINGKDMRSNDPEKGVVLDALLRASLENPDNPPSNVILFIDEPDKVLEKGSTGSFTHTSGNMVNTFLHTLLDAATLKHAFNHLSGADHSICHLIVMIGANKSFSDVLGAEKADALESRVRTLYFNAGFGRDKKEAIVNQYISNNFGKQKDLIKKIDAQVIESIINKDDELGFKGVRVLIDAVEQYVQSLANADSNTFYTGLEHIPFDIDEIYKKYIKKKDDLDPVAPPSWSAF